MDARKTGLSSTFSNPYWPTTSGNDNTQCKLTVANSSGFEHGVEMVSFRNPLSSSAMVVVVVMTAV